MSTASTTILHHLRASIDEAAYELEGEEYFHLMRQIVRYATQRARTYSRALRTNKRLSKIVKGGKR